MFKDWRSTTDDDSVVELLSRLLGIPENRTDVALEHSRDSYDANVKHTFYYLFQKQGLVANKDQLFNYRQDEYNPAQTIRDTLPILLGVSSHDRYELESKLRIAKRDLTISNKKLEQARDAVDTSHETGYRPLLGSQDGRGHRQHRRDSMPTRSSSIEVGLSWKPETMPDDDGSRISLLEEELVQLRKDRRDTQARIDAARQFAKRAGGYENEAAEQMDRLASIKALPKNPDSGEWQWPFSERNLALESPVAAVLLNELESLDKELRIATGQRPKLEAYLAELTGEADGITRHIKQKEAELSAAISANEVIAQMGTRNNAAARVVGRISLFLETLLPNEDLARLEAENRRLNNKVKQLEEQIGADDSNERLTSILNNISAQVSRYIQKFDAEFCALPCAAQPAAVDDHLRSTRTFCPDGPDRRRREPSGLPPVGTARPASVRSPEQPPDPALPADRPTNPSLLSVRTDLQGCRWLSAEDGSRCRSRRGASAVRAVAEVHPGRRPRLPTDRH